MKKIEVKIGEFIQDHLDNIMKICEKDKLELSNLQDKEYSKKYLGLNGFPFLKKVNEISKDESVRYWKKELLINNEKYRACSQFGGSKEIDGKTKSQWEGEKFLHYLKNKDILLDEYADAQVIFTVGGTPPPPPLMHNIKNIILYGPPGVGKTHNVNKLIKLIEEGKSDKEIFEAIKENKKSDYADISDIKERVKFVTFHQSFGYEDFIEGFRPNEDGNIELVDGIFKNICLAAQKNLEDSQNEKSLDVENLLNDFAREVEEQEKFEIDNNLIIEVNKKPNGELKSFIAKGRIKEQSLTKDVILRDFVNYLDGKITSYKDIKPTYESNSKYHGNAQYYFKLYQKIKDFLSSKEEYKIENVERKNYYLVIDEINRGNISKIFGELITLIEEDKRDKLEVILPYSKKPFKVPSNLYIIGTMNSTDKSIALIDIALRRRFTFLKMEPKEDLITYEKAKDIFIKLNELIKEHLGDDYKLGHSYFMNIKNDEDLDFVLNYKIIPLLEEYYYGDERLKEMLEICKTE